MTDLKQRMSAMLFAMEKHKDHKRKYTGAPYYTHLAEVAGIVAAVAPSEEHVSDIWISTAWLHDCVEDCNVTGEELVANFDLDVVHGVMALSDLETGNRKTRKKLSRERLGRAPAWVQTIKVADLISNTSSILLFDPKFAKTYLEEKRLLLEVIVKADPRLLAIAWKQCAKF